MTNSVTTGFKGFERWIGENIVGRADDFEANSADEKDHDVVKLAAAGGAVVGGAVGATTGFVAQRQDTVHEQLASHSITQPHLDGYNHHVSSDYSRHCSGSGKDEVCHSELDGWHHRFSPKISEKQVGTYTTPAFQHSKGWEPLLGGFLGALGGAAVGLGVGLGVNALRHALDKSNAPLQLSQAKRDQLAVMTGGGTLVAGVLGAGAGAWIGSHSGALEVAREQVNQRTWTEPVLVNQKLGEIPRNWYQHNWIGLGWASDGLGHGTTEVVREVPQYKADGSVQMKTVSQTFHTGRYGPVAGGIMGGLLGAGTGVAAGVALGLAAKMLVEGESTGHSGAAPKHR